MKRKIMRLGPSTLVVSLPHQWGVQQGIKPGQELEVVEKEGSLVLQSNKQVRLAKEITITITGENKDDIEVLLTHAYRQGFEKIRLKNMDKTIEEKTRRTVTTLLLGFETTTKEKDTWILESIALPAEEKYEVLLKRSLWIIKETIQNSIEFARTEQKSNITELRAEQDKYLLYCQRVLTLNSKRNTVIEWELITFLRHIEHAAYYLYQELERNYAKDTAIISLLEQLGAYYELYMNAYTNRDINAIHAINKLKSAYQFGECIKQLKKGKNTVIHAQIKEVFRMIQIGSSPIFRLILENA